MDFNNNMHKGISLYLLLLAIRRYYKLDTVAPLGKDTISIPAYRRGTAEPVLHAGFQNSAVNTFKQNQLDTVVHLDNNTISIPAYRRGTVRLVWHSQLLPDWHCKYFIANKLDTVAPLGGDTISILLSTWHS